jgi:exodeoxyribonuclease X
MIRVFDVETTGVDPKEHRVIEIAAYDLSLADSSIMRVGSHLCRPGRKIPPEASAVHHLTDIDVENAPPFAAIWGAHYAGALIYAAHNCEFEQGYLPSPEGVRWICTYKCALRAWPDAPGHSNQVLRYWLGLDMRFGFDRALASLAHRAEPDTYVTAWILAELLHGKDVETLIAWTKEPKHFAQLNFGKHRGMKLAEVPTDYLQWLRDGRHDMDADWRHCAKVELERRAAEWKAKQAGGAR